MHHLRLECVRGARRVLNVAGRLGDDATSVFRWRAVRRFARRRTLPRPHLTYLDQAKQLFRIADAFGVTWPHDRRRIELRLLWLGMESSRAYQLSDVVHLLHGRPERNGHRLEATRFVGRYGFSASTRSAARRGSADASGDR